jgi:hypothetical protein
MRLDVRDCACPACGQRLPSTGEYKMTVRVKLRNLIIAAVLLAGALVLAIVAHASPPIGWYCADVMFDAKTGAPLPWQRSQDWLAARALEAGYSEITLGHRLIVLDVPREERAAKVIWTRAASIDTLWFRSMPEKYWDPGMRSYISVVTVRGREEVPGSVRIVDVNGVERCIPCRRKR